MALRHRFNRKSDVGNFAHHRATPDVNTPPASGWTRFWAYIIDGVYLWIAIAALLFLLTAIGVSSQYGLMIAYGLALLLWLVSELYPGIDGAGSLGKRTLGLRIQTSPGHTGSASLTASLWGRWLLKMIFLFIPIVNLICLITLAADKNKRGWYDKAAGTLVVKL